MTTTAIIEILTRACETGASDLHLSSGEAARIRVDGQIKCLDETVLSGETIHGLIAEVMSEPQREKFERDNDLDFSYEVEGLCRFRVNTFRTRRGEGAAFRMIPSHVKTLDELGLPPILKELAGHQKGLILVTGPTGSGKSTTLAAMVDYINTISDGHILTIEDPIEFVHPSKLCLVNQREVGTHTPTFSAALRGALREDPDVILVGEMRDLETMQLAITAAETGHLVFATLHTSSASKTVDRIIDVFPAEQQEQIRVMLADSILAVLCQTLLKRKVGGRVAAMEILIGTPAVRNLIREGKGHQIPSAIQTGQKSGMQPKDLALAELVRTGVVTKEEAAAHSSESGLASAQRIGSATAQPAAPGLPGSRLGSARN